MEEHNRRHEDEPDFKKRNTVTIFSRLSVLCIKSVDYDNKVNLQELIKTLRTGIQETNAIGLSAIQVGIPLRVFVMNINNIERVCISPVILQKMDICDSNEGCVSFPGQYVNIKRYNKIEVSYMDDNHNVVQEWLEGLDSICFQHELDHLDGIVMQMRQSKLKRDMWLKKVARNSSTNRVYW